MRILTDAAIIVKGEKLGFSYTFFHKFLFDGFSIRADGGLVKRGGKVLDFYFYSFWGGARNDGGRFLRGPSTSSGNTFGWLRERAGLGR